MESLSLTQSVEKVSGHEGIFFTQDNPCMPQFNQIYLLDPIGNYVTFRVEWNFVFSKRDEFLIDAHVPGVILSKTIKVSHTRLAIIELRSSTQQMMTIKKHKIQIFDYFQEEIPLYIFHVFYSIFHMNWLNNGIYSLHAACVTREGLNVLLMGHSGVGKTTISLDLVSTFHFKLAYSDRTLIKIKKDGSLMTVGGTKVVTYRKQNKNISSKLLQSGITYVDRSVERIIPEHSVALKCDMIDAIVLVHLDASNQEIKKLEFFEALVSLYPFFFDLMNADALIFDGKDYFDGTKVDPLVKQHVLNGLRKTIKKIPIITLSGSLSHISKSLDSWITQKI